MTIYRTDFKAIGGPTTSDIKVEFKELLEYRAKHNGKLPFELAVTDWRDGLKISFVDSAEINELNIAHDGQPMSVYSGVLYWFLTNDKVNRWIDGRIIDGTQFIRDYANGFIQGANEFKSKNRVTDPYGLNNNIIDGYVHDFLDKYKDWLAATKSPPRYVTKEVVFESGRHSGHLEQMELIISKFPSLFKSEWVKLGLSSADFMALNLRISPQVFDKTEKPKETGPPKNIQESLKDIWIGNLKIYDEIINLLKEENVKIGKPFLTEIGGNLYWIKGITGHIQYLAGFIYTLIEKKWIADQHSAPSYKQILGRSFNIDFDPEPFKGLKGTPPKVKYLTPFKILPSNDQEK